MRINTNIAALRTVYQLSSTDDKLSTSLKKLTSGNKLVDVKENPVGASLSVKMKTQIRNLDRAAQNTSDGISVVETAEGALSEMQSMIQRINELAVQGASDSYTDQDRVSIMSEMEQIRQEIDRVSTDTDFNTKTLLDGSLSRKTFTQTSMAKVSYVSDSVKEGMYRLVYEDTAQKAQLSTAAVAAADLPEGSISINGAAVKIQDGDTLTDVYEKLVEAGEKVGVTVAYTGSLTGSAAFSFTQDEYGSSYLVEIKTSEEMANAMGLSGETVSAAGQDGTVVSLNTDGTTSLFAGSATYTVSGREIKVKDYNGFEMKIDIQENITPGDRIQVAAGVTDAGSMTIQVGANEYQELEIDIPRTNASTLGLDKIKGYTSTGCQNAITISQDAISQISAIRSKLGAYQNRMESTVASLEVTEENMTASLSRIEDVDIAEEMTHYTTYNVMTQAANSMLAQANQLPDRVLQLLQ